MASDTTTPDALSSSSSGGLAMAIRWVFPHKDGRLTPLGSGVLTFGRDAACSVCLASGSVSRQHAEIRWTAGSAAMLRDLDSTNGVFVNGRRVKQAPVKARDVLRIGDFVGILTAVPIDNAPAWEVRELVDGYWAGPTMLAALAPARLVASTDLPVILQGETGAGKEGAARAIASWSGRSGPFLSVNCAAIPEALAEGELFGYRKGAFSGAERTHLGYLRSAHGGTLLLDEIADLPLAIQAKLLRAVEQREVVPLGESRPVPIDVRLLAATQSSLRTAVEARRFRGDLLARLEGLTVVIPALRERIEEVPFLFMKLVEQHRGKVALPHLDPRLIERLCVHDWPFNVRELALLVRRLLALHPHAVTLDLDSLSERMRAGADGALPTGPPPFGNSSTSALTSNSGTSFPNAPDPSSEAMLVALRAARGNVKRAAATLRISRGRMYRLMEKLGTVDLADLRRGADD